MSDSDDQPIEYEFHRFAEFLPLLEEGDPENIQLADSLLNNSMLTPVKLFQGKILDGRRRYLAYRKHFPKVELQTEEFTGTEEEALEYAIALNADHRVLATSQRALLAWRYTRAQTKLQVKEAKEWATARFRVGKDTLELVGAITNERDFTDGQKNILLDAIGKGFPVNIAYNVMKQMPSSDWTRLVSDDDGVQASKELKALRKQKNEIKKEEKQRIKQQEAAAEISKINNISAKNGDSLKFGVILVDAPGDMDIETLAGLELPAADNCALFLWSQLCDLKDKIEVLEGWGFDYNIAYVWYKKEINDAELLLFGYKGDLQTVDVKDRMSIAQGATSRVGKPPIFTDGITAMFPTMPKLNLFGSGKDNEKGSGWYYGGTKEEPIKEASRTPSKNRVAKAAKPKSKKSKEAANETGTEQPVSTE